MTGRYEQLSLMGVKNPEQIRSYNLVSLSPDRDLLHIRYRRPPGSLLPVTRSYEFTRIAKASDPHSTVGGDLTTYEISSALNGALSELDGIVHSQDGRKAIVADLIDQVEQFEHELATLRATLRQLQSLD